MNPTTILIITTALKVLEYTTTLPHDSALALGLVKLVNILVNYAIGKDPIPPDAAIARLAALTKDVQSRTADLGGVLSNVTK